MDLWAGHDEPQPNVHWYLEKEHMTDITAKEITRGDVTMAASKFKT